MKASICILGLVIFLSLAITTQAQMLTLGQVKDSVRHAHPSLRMYDAEVQSMDATAKGAWNWIPPEAAKGFFMMPYNPSLTRKTDMGESMGQYVIAVQQIFPNRNNRQQNMTT